MKYFKNTDSDSSINIWSSFTDLVLGLFLIFLVVFTGTVYLLVEQNKLLRNVRNDLKELRSLFEEDEYLSIDNKGTISIGTEFFQTGRYELNTISEDGKQKLKNIGLKFKQFLSDKEGRKDNYTLMIAGYTDTLGMIDFNYRLSFNRARTIFEYWRSEEVNFTDAYDLVYTGYGENPKFLVVQGGNSAEQTANRRIEIRLIPKFKDLLKGEFGVSKSHPLPKKSYNENENVNKMFKNVSFFINQANASIYVNGKIITNKTLPLSVGNHSIKIEKEGYRTINEIISVTEQGQNSFYYTLIRETGSVLFSVNPTNATITLDTIYVKNDDVTTIATGEYHYAVEYRDYYKKTGIVNVTSNDTSFVPVKLDMLIGYLEIIKENLSASELQLYRLDSYELSVSIDDTKNIELPIGKYLLILNNNKNLPTVYFPVISKNTKTIIEAIKIAKYPRTSEIKEHISEYMSNKYSISDKDIFVSSFSTDDKCIIYYIVWDKKKRLELVYEKGFWQWNLKDISEQGLYEL